MGAQSERQDVRQNASKVTYPAIELTGLNKANSDSGVHAILVHDAWPIGLTMPASLSDGQEGPGKDKLKDQPKTAAQIREESAELATKLLPDALQGKWSDESKKLWQKFFADVSILPGATTESVDQHLGRLAAEINGHLPREQLNKVGMAVVQGNNGETTFLMAITPEGKVDGEDVRATMEGKAPDKIARAGTFTERQEAKPGDGRQARPEELPNIEEAQRREAAIAGKQLLDDAVKGQWSVESVGTWQKLFESATESPDFTPETVKQRLIEMASLINKRLEDPKLNTKNRFGLGVAEGPNGMVFYMLLHKPDEKGDEHNDAMVKGNNTKTAIRVGTIKILHPPDEQPRDDRMQEITQV